VNKIAFLILFTFVWGYAAPDHGTATRCLPWSMGGKPCNQKVDTSGQLCPEEQAYVAARTPMVEEALQKFLGRECSARVAYCCSGGGYRAMLSSLGFLSGMREIGLADGVMYSATLSGSTWFQVHWLLRKHLENMTFPQFLVLLEGLTREPFLHPDKYEFRTLLDKIISVLTDRGKVETADLLGTILANRLFDGLENVQDITFSPLRDAFQNNSFNEPFPLFSLILSDLFPYEWFEVNPYVSGSEYLGAFIPTSTLDSFFKNSQCSELFPEKSLGWFLAMFGSAYNFSVGDVLIFIAKESKQEWFVDMVKTFVDQHDFHDARMFASPIYNFTYGMQGGVLAHQKETELSDAGMDFNLAIPLLLREGRKVDVILVCDASTGVSITEHKDLHYAKAYADRKGIKFPPLSNPRWIGEQVLVFEDDQDKTVPAVVYFANPVPEGTLEFDYTKEEFDAVYGTIKKTVLASKEAIKEVFLRR